MSIVAISRTGYITEEKNVTTEKGVMTVENLIPDSTDTGRLRQAESELYEVFSKYGNEQGK